MTRLNIGLIGLGEATQILHIPALRQLPEQFRITGVHDASTAVSGEIAGFLPEAGVYPSAEGLLASHEIDAVLVAGPNPLHAPHTIAALSTGKHVLVEKPVCMTLAEADRLQAAQTAANRIVQVGYMRRHAPAFEEGVALVADRRDTIRFAKVRDIIGPNGAFIAPSSHVARAADLDDKTKAKTDAAEAVAIRELAGTDTGPRALVARLLLGLSTHDLSAMREMLGMPERVLSAYCREDGLFFTVQFDYGHYICQFETGIDKLARFDCELEVLAGDLSVSVLWDTPYVRNQPARLRVIRRNTENGVTVSEGHRSRQDSFVPQWQRFHASITRGASVKTDLADARQDLLLIQQILNALET